MFVPNVEAAASGADVIFLCLGNEQAAAFEPPDDDAVVDRPRRRPPARRRRRSPSAGTALTPGAWSYGLPEVHPAEGRLIANPGCYATAALLALWPLRDVLDRRRRRRREVGDDRRRADAQGELARGRGARELLARTRSAATGTRPRSSRLLGFPICFVPHLLPVRRGLLATCYVRTDADVRALRRGGVRGQPGRARAARRGRARDRARAGNRRRRDRRLHRRRRPA